MRIIGGIFLALIALFSGGCSLFFGFADLSGQGLGVAIIWGPGLLLAGLCAWGAYTLLTGNRASSAAPSANDSHPPKGPDNW